MRLYGVVGQSSVTPALRNRTTRTSPSAVAGVRNPARSVAARQFIRLRCEAKRALADERHGSAIAWVAFAGDARPRLGAVVSGADQTTFVETVVHRFFGRTVAGRRRNHLDEASDARQTHHRLKETHAECRERGAGVAGRRTEVPEFLIAEAVAVRLLPLTRQRVTASHHPRVDRRHEERRHPTSEIGVEQRRARVAVQHCGVRAAVLVGIQQQRIVEDVAIG